MNSQNSYDDVRSSSLKADRAATNNLRNNRIGDFRSRDSSYDNDGCVWKPPGFGVG
jgi:hypothetical protein